MAGYSHTDGPRLAAVLPLPARTAGAVPDTVPVPDHPASVTRLPVGAPASMPGLGPGAGQVDLEAVLTCVTGGVFRAGLTLQTALGQPAGALPQAVEQALDVLDRVVSDARTHAFADQDPPGSRPVAGEDLIRLSRLRVTQARHTRARSRETRARAREMAALSAATGERLAAALRQAAADCPGRSAELRALSRATARHAARMRERAQRRAETG